MLVNVRVYIVKSYKCEHSQNASLVALSANKFLDQCAQLCKPASPFNDVYTEVLILRKRSVCDSKVPSFNILAPRSPKFVVPILYTKITNIRERDYMENRLFIYLRIYVLHTTNSRDEHNIN